MGLPGETEVANVEPAEEESFDKLHKAIRTSLFKQTGSESKALKMMRKMGFEPGMPLGKPAVEDSPEGSRQTIIEPVVVQLKQGRGGVGYESVMKRKREEQVGLDQQQDLERVKTFRGNIYEEKMSKRIKSQITATQCVCLAMDAKAEDIDEDELLESRPTSTINVLYRLLAIQKRDLRPLDGVKLSSHEVESTDEEDAELDQFESLSSDNKLEKVLLYLRDSYNYCFFCGCQYNDKKDLENNCPGLFESDHD
jgi:hypothetical protein